MKTSIRFLIALNVICLLAIAVFAFYQSRPINAERLVRKFEADLKEKENLFLERVRKEEAYFNHVVGNDFTSLLEYFNEPEYDVFIYRNSDLVFWNNHKARPVHTINTFEEKSTLLKLKSGWYLLDIYETNRKPEDDSEIKIAGLIPVKYDYNIKNEHLESQFLYAPRLMSAAEIDENAGESKYPVLSVYGFAPFALSFAEEQIKRPENPWLYVLIVIQMIMLLGLASMLARIMVEKYGRWAGLGIMIALSLLILLLTQFVINLIGISNLPVFDVSLYGSPLFGKSLGHVSLYVSTILAIHLYFYHFFELGTIRLENGPVKLMLWLVSFALYIAYLVFIEMFVRSLIQDSVVPLEIANFLSLNKYSFLIITLIICAFVCFGLIQLRILVFLFRSAPLEGILQIVGAVLVVAMMIMSLVIWQNVISALGALIFIATYILTKRNPWYDDTGVRSSFTRVMFSIICLAMLAAIMINNFNQHKEIDKRRQIAYKFLDQRDYMAEYQFINLKDKISNDEFIKSYFSQPYISYTDILKRLNVKYYSGYFNNYEIEYIPLGSDKDPKLKTKLNLSAEEISTIMTNSIRTIDTAMVYKIQNDGRLVYHCLIPFTEDSTVLGYLYTELRPRVYSADNLYPELLVQGSLENQELEAQYSVATYSNGVLIRQTGGYPYDHYYETEEFGEEKVKLVKGGEYNHLLYNAGDNLLISVTRKSSNFLVPLATFSYMFLLFLMIYTSRFILAALYDSVVHKKHILDRLKFTFRERVNGAIIVLIMLSFILVGAVTVVYFTDEFNEFHNARLVKDEKAVLSTLENRLSEDTLQANFLADQRLLDDKLTFMVPELAETHNIDINIFDLSGNLITSSQPDIFEEGLISSKINPVAYDRICNLNKAETLIKEKIGKLGYVASYAPVRNNEGQSMAYLNIPYYARSKNFSSGISSFLVALVNAYVLLLVGAAFIALFISNSVTSSLRKISEGLRLVNLGKKNQPIEWAGEDEIGELVKEYNKMIRQLEDSAALLAKSERETAWREMAKQIAHEIKNPLTPMKLSIQYLRKAMSDNQPNAHKLAETVTNTLIEQIENLSEIATEFSSFANMPRAKNKQIKIVDVLEAVVKLFENEPNVEINFECYDRELEIFADKNQFISVFNNLVKNACQSIPDGREGRIWVIMFEEMRSVKVVVLDNGKGIPEESREKIFVPNFTTKSSGTGLGLPITKQIIENASGEIWFDSNTDHGTEFYVTIPLYENTSIFNLG